MFDWLRRRGGTARPGMAMVISRQQAEGLVADLERCLDIDEAQTIILMMDPYLSAAVKRKAEEARIEGEDTISISWQDIQRLPAPGRMGSDAVFTVAIPMTVNEFMDSVLNDPATRTLRKGGEAE